VGARAGAARYAKAPPLVFGSRVKSGREQEEATSHFSKHPPFTLLSIAGPCVSDPAATSGPFPPTFVTYTWVSGSVPRRRAES